MQTHDYIQNLEQRLQSAEACITTLLSAGKNVLVNDSKDSRQTLINAIQEVKDAPQRVSRLEALERLYVTTWRFSKGEARILDLVCAVNAVKQFDAEGI
jgi:hypoxanthine phosphoribosyltransferase